MSMFWGWQWLSVRKGVLFWVAFVHHGRHPGQQLQQQFSDGWSTQDGRHTGQKRHCEFFFLLFPSGNLRLSELFPPNISFNFSDCGDYGLLRSQPVVRISVY